MQSNTQIVLQTRDQEFASSHDGIGPVEAPTTALAAQGINIEVLELHQTSIGHGNDSEALTVIEYRNNDRTGWPAGRADSVLGASMAAIMNAVKMIPIQAAVNAG